MSDTTVQQPSRREQKRAERDRNRADKAQRKDDKRAAKQGRKLLKAAYTLAAAERKRIDPAVREQIGRAKLGPADLQALAHSAVNGKFQPDRYGNHTERLSQVANARLNATRAPRNNFVTRHNRYSRWRRNERAGTKALKQAFTQAARDVKKTDPAVLAAIGRSRFTSLDLASLSSGQVGRVFQQGQNGRGQQPQGAGRGPQPQAGIQSRDAVRQAPAPQSEQLNQRIIALQQSIIENQQRTIALLEQNNQLQAQMQQLLQERAAQVQQQNGDQNQLTNPPQALGQEGQQAGEETGTAAPAPQSDPQALGEQTSGEAPAVGAPGEPGVGEQSTSEQGTGQQDTSAPPAVGEQGQQGEAAAEGGEPAAVGEQGGEQELGGTEAPAQSEPEQAPAQSGPEQAPVQGGPEQAPAQGGPEQAPVQAEVSEGERWTQAIQNDNPYANGQQGTGNQQQPVAAGPQAQQGPTGPQAPNPNGQQAQQGGGVQAEEQGAAVDPELAKLRQVSMGGQKPLDKVSGNDVKNATQESQGDTGRPQHGNQGPNKSTQSKPSGKQI
jgi:hypothetical protein